MSERRFFYDASLSWGGDVPTAEVDVRVSFTVAWGSPESGRFGPPENYDPGSPDVIEDVRLELVNGKPRPWGMYYGYVADEDAEFETEVIEKLEGCEEEMLREAAETLAGEHEGAAERRAEERREDARGGW